MIYLRVCDTDPNNSVRIIDEDRLCFIVQSSNRGATGIRTISKQLLEEFIQYELTHPESSAQDARVALCGNTEVDKFEYGYSSTLWTLAKLNNSLKSRKGHKVSAPLQQITYGAPGTGKSHGTEDIIESIYPDKEERKLNVFRTTFHPDSDYSTFVGCYKPTKQDSIPVLSKDELIAELKQAKASGISYPCHRVATKYWKSLKDFSREDIIDILLASGFTETMCVEVGKCVAVGEGESKYNRNSTIVYSFVPQAFTKAFIRAYELLDDNKPVFLVIEEINRGNCAQIFGDLFQLLDREDDGYSKYAIKPDTDLENYLVDKLGDKYDVDEGMKLPKNLHIWATMNTSDQSLFPIDSAFKRRWDWKYVPISRKNANYQIEVEKDGKLMRYDWWEFLDKVNTAIGNATSSEDKKLGYFFCKADKKANETDKDPRLITADRFVGKVIFYLWNDVFKDYEIGDAKFSYTYKDGDKKDQTVELSLLSTKVGEKEIKREFSSFFDDMGNAKLEEVVKLMDELNIEGKEVVVVESKNAPDSDFQV